MPQPEIEQKQEFEQEREFEMRSRGRIKTRIGTRIGRERNENRNENRKQNKKPEPEQEQEQQEPKSDHEEEANQKISIQLRRPIENEKKDCVVLQEASNPRQCCSRLSGKQHELHVPGSGIQLLTRKHHCRFAEPVSAIPVMAQLPAHDEDAAPNTQSNMEHTKTEASSEKTGKNRKCGEPASNAMIGQ